MILYLFSLLGYEFRALFLLGRCSTAWSTPEHNNSYLSYPVHFQIFHFSQRCFLFVCFISFSWTVLAIELKLLHFLGGHLPLVTLPLLFVLVIFEIGFHFIPISFWSVILLSRLPLEARMTGMYHCTHPLVNRGSLRIFSRLVLSHSPLDLHL
jgi:hypothetical protein